MFAGVTSDVTSNESVPCRAAPCKSQGTAAEVESEVMGDGDTTFLAASAAGGMSGRVSPTVFAGVGDDGSSAPSRSRFLAEYVALFWGTRLAGSGTPEASGGPCVPEHANPRHIPFILLGFAQGFLWTPPGRPVPQLIFFTGH